LQAAAAKWMELPLGFQMITITAMSCSKILITGGAGAEAPD
jgi:hypothetical protein